MTCSGCPRDWSGFSECHCAECHRHFTGLSAFDAHFGKNGECQDPPLIWPETEKKSQRAGKPAFELKQRSHGLVWGQVGDNIQTPRFVALRKARAAENAS